MMNTRYFCAYHAERIKACETHALRCWVEMMRRGVQAYTECRLEAAQIYLGSALDIGLLRFTCAENNLFEEIHLTKPADFIIELRLSDADYGTARDVLNRISDVDKASGKHGQSIGGNLRDYVATQLARREFATRAASVTVLPPKNTLRETAAYH